MKKLLITLCFLAFVHQSFAATSKSVTKTISREIVQESTLPAPLLIPAYSEAKVVTQAKSSYFPTSIAGELGATLSTPTVSSNVPMPVPTGVLGGSVGANAEIPLSQTFFVQPGIQYVQRGYSIVERNSSNSEIIETTVRMNYLQVPVLMKAKFETTYVNVFLVAGPSMAVLLSKSSQTQVGKNSNLSATPELKPVDFYFTLGTGAEYDFDKRFGVFGAFRYSMGLMNVASQTQSAFSLFNNNFELLVGPRFIL